VSHFQSCRKIVSTHLRSNSALVRPPDLVGGLRFYRDSSIFYFLLFFSPATPRARWTELIQNWSHAGKWMFFWKCMSEIRMPLQIGGPKTIFSRRLRNLTATLTVYVFGTKRDIHNQTHAFEAVKRLQHRLKSSWTLLRKRL